MANKKLQDRYLTWAELDTLVDKLVRKVRRRKFDLYLVISRGGLIPGGLLAKRVPFCNIVVASIQWYQGKRKRRRPMIRQFPAEPALVGKREHFARELASIQNVSWMPHK